MRHEYYDVDSNPCSYETWTDQWHDPNTKIVAQDTVAGSSVSTVYLGTDHGWGDGPPLIFETMVFEDGPLDQECVRYSTREQAVAGHGAMIQRVKVAHAMRFADL